MHKGKRKKMSQEEMDERASVKKQAELGKWVPKTDLGKKVKNGDITSIDQIFEQNKPILESEIVDFLLPDIKELTVDFAKTTKVKRAGRQFSFRASVLVGDKNQYIGLGSAKDKEKWPAVTKAAKRAKQNMIKIRKGCGSWECVCGTGHSVPFKVEGKSASVRIILMPAPKGTGLVVGSNIKTVMEFVGIRDVWGKSRGRTKTKLNSIEATLDALSKTTKMKISKDLENKTKKELK